MMLKSNTNPNHSQPRPLEERSLAVAPVTGIRPVVGMLLLVGMLLVAGLGEGIRLRELRGTGQG